MSWHALVHNYISGNKWTVTHVKTTTPYRLINNIITRRAFSQMIVYQILILSMQFLGHRYSDLYREPTHRRYFLVTPAHVYVCERESNDCCHVTVREKECVCACVWVRERGAYIINFSLFLLQSQLLGLKCENQNWTLF